MSLRTFQLITHPAFLRFVEASRLQLDLFPDKAAADAPIRRPDIQEAADIARYLGISPMTLRSLIRLKYKHYRSFEYPKKSGGMRRIDAPRTFLKVVQWWIYDTVLSQVEPSPHAFGFVKGKSYVENARFHAGADYLLNVDIKNFFPSIDIVGATEVFSSFGYRTTVASTLAELCTFQFVLPQGAPTSPSVANLYMLECDGELNEIASHHGLKFSRYADDITMSGSERVPTEILGKIQDVLRRRNLTLNDAKTKFMGKNQRKEVTGVILGRDGIALSDRYLNSARGWFYRIALKPDQHKEELDKIRGTVSTIRQVGGRGSNQVIDLGMSAIYAVERSMMISRQAPKA